MSQFRDLIDPANVLEASVLMAKDVVSVHGCLVRRHVESDSPDSIQHAPFTLFPSPVPRKCFLEAQSIQLDVQLLLHKIAHDYNFLKEALESVIKVDDFTRNIWEIFDTVTKENVSKPASLAMIRSDYMIDSKIHNFNTTQKNNSTTSQTNRSDNLPANANLRIQGDDTTGDFDDPKLVQDLIDSYESYPKDVTLKQVEVNTMSASFPGLAQRLYKYHRFIVAKGQNPEYNDNVPENHAAKGFAEGMLTAWKCYNNEKAVILFLVFEVERNIYDQRLLEVYVSRSNPKVKVIRRSIEYMQRHARMDERDERRLFVDDMEVAIVYQRSCYKPQDFSGGSSLWKCRLMMERSRAIICPSAGYHLAGTKKVQQVLFKPGVLERFLSNGSVIERIRRTFATQYGLDRNQEGDRALEMAIQNPQNFVVKPQREGGGNNVYGQDVADLLTTIRHSDARMLYILMERITPMYVYNYPIIAHETSLPTPCHSTTDVDCANPHIHARPVTSSISTTEAEVAVEAIEAATAAASTAAAAAAVSAADLLSRKRDNPKPKLTEMVSELGIYGVLIASENEILLNKQCGYLLRTKKADTNEGGVATGYSVLDSPYLIG